MTILAIAHGDPPAPNVWDTPAVGLRRAIELFPDGRFLHIAPEGHIVEQTYREVWRSATCILSELRANGLGCGDPIVIHVADVQKAIPVLWAALLGGLTVVPVSRHPMGSHRAHQSEILLRYVLGVLPKSRIITDQDPGSSTEIDGRRTADLSWAMLAEASREPDVAEPQVGAAAEKLVIPSSGTTGRPNLVALDSAAIVARWWPSVPDAAHAVTFLSWSPFDHIMGVGLASPNLPTKVHLPADHFVRAPASWLDAIEETGTTHATMTNFGMSLVLRALADMPSRCWDLSSVRKIGIGAEAVTPELCSRFIRRLTAFGLRDDAVILGYGLTECGPVVGGTRPFLPVGQDHETAYPILDRPTRGHSVRIVDDEGRILREQEVGRVEVRGPTMTAGYLGDPERTAQLFTLDGWLRTGDRGLLEDGHLTVTGRDKEMIVVNARKYACIDIEACLQKAGGVEAAYAVPFTPDLAAETPQGKPFGIFIVLPFSATAPQLASAAKRVRRAVAATFGFVPALVMAIDERDIPRTAGGKVQRLRLLDLVANEPNHPAADWLGRVQPTNIEPAVVLTPTQSEIATIWTNLLAHDAFGPHDDFFEAGGNSVAAVQLLLELERRFARSLPASILHGQTTITRLATILDQDDFGLGQAGKSVSRPAVQPTADGLPQAVKNRLRHLIDEWPGQPVVDGGLIRLVQKGGAGLPLFFCVQTLEEANNLGAHFGPDRPVYALRSGHLAMTYGPETTPHLARCYVEEMEIANPDEPFVIGGTCQGAIVALEIARQLVRAGRTVRLLIMMDTDFWSTFEGHPYAGPVAFFAGDRSRFNPYRRFRTPEAGWRKLLPAGGRLWVLKAEYGRFFLDPVLNQFVPKFAEALQWSKSRQPNPSATATGAYPATAYASTITTVPALSMAPGQIVMVNALVTNSGSAVWQPFDVSGLQLGNHWLSLNGEILIWADGRAALSEAVAPGQSVTMALPVQAPAQPGDYLLQVDLVEEGVLWFAERATYPGHVQVTVRQEASRGPKQAPRHP